MINSVLFFLVFDILYRINDFAQLGFEKILLFFAYMYEILS